MELLINLSGDGFKPSLLKLDVIILAETGLIADRGRYKNKISPYGMCFYTIDINEEDFDTEVEKQMIELRKIPLKEFNITDIEFSLSEFKNLTIKI